MNISLSTPASSFICSFKELTEGFLCFWYAAQLSSLFPPTLPLHLLFSLFPKYPLLRKRKNASKASKIPNFPPPRIWLTNWFELCTCLAGFPRWCSGKESACQCRRHETRVQSPGQEDALEKKMATYSSILAWKISWTVEAGGPQSMGSQSWIRLGDWAHTYICLLPEISSITLILLTK